MKDRAFLFWTGVALGLAGVILVAINLALTPFLPRDSFAALAASDVFLIRQCAAALAAALMLFGVIGLHVGQLHRIGVFGGVAFTLAVLGAAGLFSVEWNQAFTIRDFALQAPQTLEAVEDAEGITPFDIGALIASSAFFLGWLLFAISLLLARVHSRIGGSLVLIGFVAAPALSLARIDAVWASAAASAVIGAGWLLLGAGLMRAKPVST